jgi:hypothetical protein
MVVNSAMVVSVLGPTHAGAKTARIHVDLHRTDEVGGLALIADHREISPQIGTLHPSNFARMARMSASGVEVGGASHASRVVSLVALLATMCPVALRMPKWHAGAPAVRVDH